MRLIPARDRRGRPCLTVERATCYDAAILPHDRPRCRVRLRPIAERRSIGAVNVLLGVLRFGFLGLLVALTIYIVWLIRRDLDRR